MLRNKAANRNLSVKNAEIKINKETANISAKKNRDEPKS
jgi:hypothetical protein